ncbi:MAG: dolichyl-phosphate mannose synthase related protein [Candidatus Methanoperedens nitroreducens]|uniref:Dolichyl-phosphate mannose synthase related protein n=1 Tax=Candidatus Methanoperedens nitratireducens TaxID=1392998 RepID=A0A0N8KRC0_9EURY|nr:MAG: dolichyl-phosphate mannose synthase related protein [Candidatus Methanoperedens sp. BLZ1]
MISVIVPTYNEEANITACLQSLCNQTISRDEYEIIVVDGNSNDRTYELAQVYADEVMTQTSKKVGGARNDGVLRACGDIVATTDADCIIPPEWLEIIKNDFESHDIVQLYGTVYPIEEGLKHKISLMSANTFSRIGYYTRALYYTLGCNTAFDKEAFLRAGMYQCIDAGDDVEIALRMRKIGRVMLDDRMKVGFSMRRFQQFGMIKSVYEWLYIVANGGEASGYSYSKRNYK